MFNTRIIFGTIAAAGMFAATAAAPAMATPAGHPKTDRARPVLATRPVTLGGVPLPAPGVSVPGGLSPVTGPLEEPLCPALGWIPIVGSTLFCGGEMSGAPAMGNPLGGALNGVTGAMNGATGALGGALSPVTGALGGATGALGGANNAVPGLGGVTGAVNGVLKGVTGAVNKLPVVGGVAGNVASTAQGAIGGVTGALNGVTSLVPGLGSLSGLEHAAPLGH